MGHRPSVHLPLYCQHLASNDIGGSGRQWCNGRVLASRTKGLGFEFRVGKLWLCGASMQMARVLV